MHGHKKCTLYKDRIKAGRREGENKRMEKKSASEAG
jgi:hypothetical protein